MGSKRKKKCKKKKQLPVVSEFFKNRITRGVAGKTKRREVGSFQPSALICLHDPSWFSFGMSAFFTFGSTIALWTNERVKKPSDVLTSRDQQSTQLNAHDPKRVL
jgi:hypothetical protein